MRGLGYESYGAHGSDGGAMVSRELAKLNPAGFLGAHVLQLFSFPSGDPAEFEKMGPADYAALEFAGWFQTVNGYAQMNASRPQTIAAALSDSPVGQLAYNELFENFGNGTSLVTRDQVLTQVSLYWLTNTSAGSVRYHYTEKSVEPTRQRGSDRRHRVRRRLQVDATVRGARQHQHRVVDRAAPRRSLRIDRGAGRAGRGDPGLLRGGPHRLRDGDRDVTRWWRPRRQPGAPTREGLPSAARPPCWAVRRAGPPPLGGCARRRRTAPGTRVGAGRAGRATP